MAVCSAEGVVHKGITTTYGQRSTLHMLFITLESSHMSLLQPGESAGPAPVKRSS